MNPNPLFGIDSLVPRAIETPATPEDLARIVASAAKANLALVPWGGGTMQHLGNAPRQYDLAIELTRLNRIVEYTPDDLTITVQAGTTIAVVQAALATHKQFLPLDPALPAQATIGGTLAANVTGPLRLRYGPARDFTLGMSVVNAEGKITKSGGKVVKNVAGYELPKLYIGALGTLGIITQVTFKVFPKSPEQVTVAATFSNASDACKTVRALWNLTTPPAAIELLDANTARTAGLKADSNHFVVVTRFNGNKSVADAATLKSRDAARNGNAASIETIPGEGLWNAIENLPATLRERHSAGALFQIGLPPAQLNAALEKISAQLNGSPLEFFAHAATATLYLAFDASEEKIIAATRQLREALAPLGAHVIVESAPRGVKEKLAVWGEPGAEHFIAQRLKEKFDPQGIFNPGRFVGGL